MQNSQSLLDIVASLILLKTKNQISPISTSHNGPIEQPVAPVLIQPPNRDILLEDRDATSELNSNSNIKNNTINAANSFIRVQFSRDENNLSRILKDVFYAMDVLDCTILKQYLFKKRFFFCI